MSTFTFNLQQLTEDNVRKLILFGDDSHDNQIRVKKDGTVYLSQVTGAEEIDDVLFRFETFDAGNDYVGSDASNDKQLINRLYKALKANWPIPIFSYIDDWNVPGRY